MNRRTITALLFTIVMFAVLRVIDAMINTGAGAIGQIESFVASHVRANMVIFVSVATGTYVARSGFLKPVLVLVVCVWAAELINTYIHRADYLTTLRVVDLDWLGAFMAIVSTVVAVKTGEWIWKVAVESGAAET